MREAIGSTFVLNFIFVFIIIFIFMFVGTLAYTKAFKVKNSIVNTIENFDGEITNGNRLKGDVQTEIDNKLGDMGYRIDPRTTCEIGDRFKDSVEVLKSSNYRYCIYKTNTSKGDYYSVVAYIYFELPIIGTKLEFPVYGETRVFMDI